MNRRAFSLPLSFPLLLLAAILQSTVVPEIRIGDGGPDLVLLLVLSWTLLSGLPDGLLWAMIGGILQDALNGSPIGTTALALVIVVFVVNSLLGTVGRKNIIFPPFALAVGTLLYHLAMIVLLSILGQSVSLSYALLYITLPTMLFNLILALPVFRVMGLLFDASRPRRVTLN